MALVSVFNEYGTCMNADVTRACTDIRIRTLALAKELLDAGLPMSEMRAVQAYLMDEISGTMAEVILKEGCAKRKEEKNEHVELRRGKWKVDGVDMEPSL